MRSPISIDPTLAAAAYLAQIPMAARQLAARAAEADHWRAATAWAVTGLGLLLMSRSRLFVHLQLRLAATPSLERLATPICALVFGLLLTMMQALAAILSSLIWPSVATSADFSGLFTKAIAIGFGLWLLLAAVHAAPRWGWVWLSALAAVAIAGAVLIPPLTLLPQGRHDTPTAGPAVASILAFANRGGLKAQPLYVFESADPFAVDMEGVGPFMHAAVSRAALTAPHPETFAAIGHLLGHHQHKDLWSLTLLWSGFFAVFLFAVWRWGRSVAVRLGAGAAAPVIGLIAWGVMSLATPVFNLFDQAINYRADDFAMSLTHDPDTLCRWIMAAEAGGKADPSPLETLLFYDHPPLKARLENAMRWKAAHGGL